MLGWLFFGLAAALQGARVSNDHQPVFLLNSDIPFGTSEIVNGIVAPELVAYFIGECFDSSSDSNHIITRLVDSPLIIESEPTVIIVENLELSYFEKKLGSPRFYLEKGSADSFEHRFTKVTVSSFKSNLLDPHIKFISIDAHQNDADYNEVIWQTLEQLPNTRVMLIGSSKSGRRDSNEIKVASARPEAAEPSSPFNKIPNFFETEGECSSLTKNCSGRGNCVKGSNGLFGCNCQASVEGDHTLYWGGSDCSKRDVSTQFNLIVGTALAIVIVAVLSIQLLFNLGSEPLPGILDISSSKS